MKVMLSIIGVVASIATVDMAIIKYREDSPKMKYPTDENVEVIFATIINAEFMWALDRDIEEHPHGAVTLFPDRIPDVPQGNHPICGPSLGIDLNNGRPIFCRMNRIEIVAKKMPSGNDSTRMVASFGFQTNSSLVLVIPIYTRPARFEEEGQEQAFKDWAAEHKVKIVFPLNAQQLVGSRHDTSYLTDFLWLNELLSLGMFKADPPPSEDERTEVHLFFARPLVLATDVTDKLLELIYWRELIDEDMVLPSTSISPR